MNSVLNKSGQHSIYFFKAQLRSKCVNYKEKNMRLSPELCAEYDFIKRFVYKIIEIVGASNPKTYIDWIKIMNVYTDDLRSHKIKLQNMVSSTDCKNQKLELLRLLLEIEWLFSHKLTFAFNSEFVDCCKMGLKIDPNEPRFNYRNLLFYLS